MIVRRPAELPIGATEHRAAPFQPGIMHHEPCTRGPAVARIQCERGGETLQRERLKEGDGARSRGWPVGKERLNLCPREGGIALCPCQWAQHAYGMYAHDHKLVI